VRISTAAPRRVASASVMPTWPTSGLVNVHQGMLSADTFARPGKSALASTMRACASELCVKWSAEQTSPAA
jgi:hypothetical protein